MDTPALRFSHTRLLGLFAGAVLAIGVLIIATGLLPRGVGDFSLSQDLGNAWFLAEVDGQMGLFAYDFGSFHPVLTEGHHSISSVARRGEDFAVIETLPNGFYTARIGNEAPLASSNLPKMSVSFSPGKNALAYVEAMPEAVAASQVGQEGYIEKWRVVVIDAESKKQIVLGEGFSPFFTDDTHVLWFSPAGVMLTDITMNTSELLDTTPSTSILPLPGPVVSPDGTHIAWVNKDAAISVYRITDTKLELIVSYTEGNKSPFIALGNDALYSFVPSKGGTEIYRSAFESGALPAHVYSLEGKRVIQLIP